MGADQPVRDDGSVLGAVRLLRRSSSGAVGAYLLEDRDATRSFSSLDPKAGRDSAAEPIESATCGLLGVAA
jgi:hypothetical protein